MGFPVHGGRAVTGEPEHVIVDRAQRALKTDRAMEEGHTPIETRWRHNEIISKTTNYSFDVLHLAGQCSPGSKLPLAANVDLIANGRLPWGHKTWRVDHLGVLRDQ